MSQLAGLNILLTRPAGQNELWQQALEVSGARCFQLPLIEITSTLSNASSNSSKTHKSSSSDWLIFVSPNAVRHGLPSLEPLASKTQIAAVGKATARMLSAAGIANVVQPKSEQNSEGLLALDCFAQIEKQNILIVRGDGGRDLLANALTERGAKVDYFECYQRSCPQYEKSDFQSLQINSDSDNPSDESSDKSNDNSLVLLTSNQSIDHWFQLKQQLPLYWQQSPCMVIGQRQLQHFEQMQQDVQQQVQQKIPKEAQEKTQQTQASDCHKTATGASALVAAQADISAIQTSINHWYNAPHNKMPQELPKLAESESTGTDRREPDMSEQSKNHDSTATDKSPLDAASSANKATKKSDNMTQKPAKPSSDSSPKTNLTSNKTTSSKTASNKKSGAGGIVLSLAALAVSGALAFAGWQLWQQQQQISQIAAEEALMIDSKINQLSADVSRQTAQLTAANSQLINANSQLADAQNTLRQQQLKDRATLQKVLDVAGRRPNSWALSEAEYLVRLANRHLALDQDLRTALALLQAADQSLAKLDDPRLIRLRSLLNQDINQLKSIRPVDIEGVVFKLQGLIAQVNQLPLVSPKPFAKTESNQPQFLPVWGSQWLANLENNASAAWQKVSDNFIIREYQGDTPALLMPEQRVYLNHNLQLQLRQASLAVLKGQQKVYSQSLAETEQWIGQYLDANSLQARAFLETLAELKQVKLESDLPQATRAVDELYKAVNGLLDQTPVNLGLNTARPTPETPKATAPKLTPASKALPEIDPPKMIENRAPVVVPQPPGPTSPDVKSSLQQKAQKVQKVTRPSTNDQAV
ncbi:uroporphyrinogen-III C-methyltransferase [Pelagibaculum spongiae]|uniref:Tetrapyrrole biosynthesis uroporphyrinogen III synthase domain-containing protein n=1 Tax=Pelagibaculum spongiae TaxID=2080658 RepID=A0A2V1GXF8_9GAMM|nr:uroporphyrinogen-III C-methyltransferase [Pelagibaculum spongiae]PVZ70333.1 hypothetical protein DC094_06985 [Pelagibaculum spongiae]